MNRANDFCSRLGRTLVDAGTLWENIHKHNMKIR